MKVIITGATGMVGEGVLFECLNNKVVTEVLIISRRHYDLQHPKVRELIIPDFFQLDTYANQVAGYDACYFCAGISSIGMNEDKFRHITYDTTLAFASSLVKVNTNMVFIYVSGAHTDSSEKGRVMWARIKGKTENDLARLPFRREYNFRPGVMMPFADQKNWKALYKWLARFIALISPKNVITMQELGRAMIYLTVNEYPGQILEVSAIKELGSGKLLS